MHEITDFVHEMLVHEMYVHEMQCMCTITGSVHCPYFFKTLHNPIDFIFLSPIAVQDLEFDTVLTIRGYKRFCLVPKLYDFYCLLIIIIIIFIQDHNYKTYHNNIN